MLKVTHREYAAIRVGFKIFKRFFRKRCVNMLVYVLVLRGFLLAMCDCAAIRVDLSGFVNTEVTTLVNSLVNALVNTLAGILVNTP